MDDSLEHLDSSGSQTDGPDAMLVVERGVDNYSVIPLEQPVYVLGRSALSDIVLNNVYVPRRHAMISLGGGHIEIEDLGSKNGTFVNGRQLSSQPHRFKFGDRIELGLGQVVFSFQHWRSTATLPPVGQTSSEGLWMNVRSREVWLHGQKVVPPLSRKEFEILTLLFYRQGEICSKDEIAARGWPECRPEDVADQDIEQYIRRLRVRLESDPSPPQLIITVRGSGYRLSEF